MVPRVGLFGAALLVAITSAGCRLVSAARTSIPRRGVAIVHLTATPEGCGPQPSTVRAGMVEFVAKNLDAPAVSEIELRTADFDEVLGEKEYLIEGLSGAFSAQLTPGRYVVSCPGAVQGRWWLSVSSASKGS
jgi:iron uptake system component EfeO